MIQCFDQLDKMERAQFLCNECGKGFVDDVNLGLHQYAVHTEKPFECAQCGEKGSGVQKFLNNIVAQTHEDCVWRETREASTVQPVWQNLANKRKAYPTREKPPFLRIAVDLLL